MSDIVSGFVWSDKAENFASNKAMALRLNKTINEATVNLDEVLPSQAGQAGKVLSTNGSTTQWIAASGGTVTSVGISAGTGISVSGSPITSSGSITVTNSTPLPSGGAKYARLAKNSTTNYDVGWYGPYVVNVKDYGATGDGSTDDTSAINAAIAALTNKSTLFFPAGKYLHTGLNAISSLSDILILGEAAELYLTVNANNTWVFNNSSSRITVEGIWFNGVGTSRANGIHLRIYSDFTVVRNCRFERCSDWAIQVDNAGGSPILGFECHDNLFKDTLGDGVHVMNVDGFKIEDNVFWECGDDAIAALAQSTTVRPVNGIIKGNLIYGRTTAIAGASTSGFRGIVVFIGENILIEGNIIYNTNGHALEIGDEYNSSLNNINITISGNHIEGCNHLGGALGSVLVYFADRSTFSGNTVINPVSASCVAFADLDAVNFSDNTLIQTTDQFCRGFVTNTSASYSGRSILASANVSFVGNRVHLQQANNNEAFYIPFTASAGASNLAVANNVLFSNAATYLISDYVSVFKVVNNTGIGGTSISTGGSSTSVTTANNN